MANFHRILLFILLLSGCPFWPIHQQHNKCTSTTLIVWAAVIVASEIDAGVHALLWREAADANNKNLTDRAVGATILQNLNVYNGDDDDAMGDYDEEPVHYRLERHLMSRYNNRLIPRRSTARPIQVLFTIGLYQIIEVNEPQQYILLNSWIVERWRDDLLHWAPAQFGGLREIVLPRDSVWIPDTTLYNSLVMDDEQSRRILNVKLNTLQREKSALVEMLYPTLYQFSCMLDLRFFPYDIQHCVMMFGSWSHDNTNIDYFAYDDISDSVMPPALDTDGTPLHDTIASGGISIEHCIPNEGWNILSTEVSRREVKFACCENNYTLLEFKLHIQRRPLFYLVNLIIPTSIITLIAIVGFFSSSTVNDVRDEKISLGITTLLSMSILIFMVSDQMPSTSSFIPLIGWFYTSMMALISGGTLAASFVIYVQKKGIIGQRPSRRTMLWARRLGKMVWMEMPLMMKQAYAIKAKQDKIQKIRQHLELQHQKELRRQQQQQNGGPNQQGGIGTASPRKNTFWQIRTRIGGATAGIGQPSTNEALGTVTSGLGTALGRYRTTLASGTAGTGGTDIASGTAFVGPTLGHAMGLLMPRGGAAMPSRSGADTPNSAHKVSQSINEEASDELEESNDSNSSSSSSTSDLLDTKSFVSANNESDATTTNAGATATSGNANNRKHTIGTVPTTTQPPNAITMIDIEEEEPLLEKMDKDVTESQKPSRGRAKLPKAGQNGPFASPRPRAKSSGPNGPETGTLVRKITAPPTHSDQTQLSSPHQSKPQQLNNQYSNPRNADNTVVPNESINLQNPLVANVACVEPLRQWAQQLLDRQRDLERQMECGGVGRKRQGGGAKGSRPIALNTRRSTSYQSMADLYAASMLPTPAEPAFGAGAIGSGGTCSAGGAAATDTGTTLAEASATLAALHPQVQRNLAEIEYDWLAAVVERMFLILFCTLFFLMSFGINGIGLYYWYFFFDDTIKGS
ncbi:hypothetical protein niasHT_019306 [Heterodera trifolii]|uniref:Uncharacterized protein n=1 Tax=Heterodera trifolii TaxID=157864 RepID=A0ABD2L5E4_9BILA